MAITHSKVSAIPDGADATLIRPSDWNDEHVVSGLTTDEFASPNISQWTNDAGYITSGGSSAFADITSGTNTTAAMVVGTGSSIAASGSGTIAATSCTGNAATSTILANGRTISISGDLTYTSPSFEGSGNVTAAGTLATVNGNVGSFGSVTKAIIFTVNAKGLVTAASESTITPAVGSITGFGTGVATALAINIGTAGSFVVNGGALGTPSSGTATNLTGTASGLTAGAATILATARAIYGNNFDGSAALTQIIASTYGGTGNGFSKLSGATTTEKTYTLPDATCTILTNNAAVTVAQGGTNATSSGITAFNNITGYTAAGATGTTSTNLVFSTSPSLVTPALGVATFTSLNGGTIGDVAVVPVQGYRPVNTQTGTSYTLVLGDAGKLITLNNASSIALTIPANASVAFVVGTEIDLLSLGAGIVTVSITTDTLNSKNSKVTLTAQYSGATLRKITSTSWVLVGDLA